MAKEKSKPTKRPTAEKRRLQDEKKKERRKSFKSQIKTAIRSLLEATKNNEQATLIKEKLNKIYSLLDKSAKKNIFKKNKVARLKSKFTRKTREKK